MQDLFRLNNMWILFSLHLPLKSLSRVWFTLKTLSLSAEVAEMEKKDQEGGDYRKQCERGQWCELKLCH